MCTGSSPKRSTRGTTMRAAACTRSSDGSSSSPGIGSRRSTISARASFSPRYRGAAGSVGAGGGPPRRGRGVQVARDGSDGGSARSGAVDAELLALSALGALELSLGNASGARDHLERAWQLHRLAGFGEPAMFPFVADHAMALLELGANAEATEVVEWLEERGRALHRPWALAVAARSRALLAATDGDFQAAFEALAVALEEHERLPMPFELGMNAVILGTVRRRAKQKASRQGGSRGSHRDLRATRRAIVGREGASRGRSDRWTPAGRRADAGRTACGDARRRRSHQSRDRRDVVHERPDRRGPSLAHLPQARHPIPHGARGVLRSRARRPDSEETPQP